MSDDLKSDDLLGGGFGLGDDGLLNGGAGGGGGGGEQNDPSHGMNYYYNEDGEMALKEGYGFNQRDGYGNAFYDIVAIQNENNSIERDKS